MIRHVLLTWHYLWSRCKYVRSLSFTNSSIDFLLRSDIYTDSIFICFIFFFFTVISVFIAIVSFIQLIFQFRISLLLVSNHLMCSPSFIEISLEIKANIWFLWNYFAYFLRCLRKASLLKFKSINLPRMDTIRVIIVVLSFISYLFTKSPFLSSSYTISFTI